MIAEHVNEVDLTLYASGYGHFASESLKQIQLHLAECQDCRRRLQEYLEKLALEKEADDEQCDAVEEDLLSAWEREAADHSPAQRGLRIYRYFASTNHPLDSVTWKRRCARVRDGEGNTIFEQADVDAPASWSQLSVNVMAGKYFHGRLGSAQREFSVRRVIDRVTSTISRWASQDGLFASQEDSDSFYRELTYLCVNQYGAFNSPVWFNVGLSREGDVPPDGHGFGWNAKSNSVERVLSCSDYPQSCACFIQSVDDSLDGLLRLAIAEANVFRYGGGTGSDLSTLRSKRESVGSGGNAAGPLSFMRMFDSVAGTIRSGGRNRRAAKMTSLRADHPDVLEFIECKAREEKKAWSLINDGYSGAINGEAYSSIDYQNTSLAVRVTDEFMRAAVSDGHWQTYLVRTREAAQRHKAKELLKAMAQSAWVCGDPGIQYHTTINRWNTCRESGEIRSSNPCSEYMFLDDSACNLASLNLLKFVRSDGELDVKALCEAVRLFIIAQDTLIDHSSYPTPQICRNSHDFRPLGLGYANLGALLMSLGLPYDSDAARARAAAITAIMTAAAYLASAELASKQGPFPQFSKNRQCMLSVLKMHQVAVEAISPGDCPKYLRRQAMELWIRAVGMGEKYGYRNSQVTVLAPTGTIGFMMDCDTTGIEPDLGLVKYKLLSDGGVFKMVNRTVPLALRRLGYSQQQSSRITTYIEQEDTIEGAPELRQEHLPVFDCAFRPHKGKRTIHYMGHLRMMSAVQPFVSGAIAKTVNLPNESTAEEIVDIFINGWKLGLKSLSVYRDGSKRTQPVSLVNKSVPQVTTAAAAPALQLMTPHRRRLAQTRPAIVHKFEVAGHEGYVHVGLYEDDKPGEVFVTMAKEGSTIGGMMDAFATAVSLCLQYGVPLEAMVKKFCHQRFEPAGMTANPDIPFAKSIVDYIFRWLSMRFLEQLQPAPADSHLASASALSRPEPEAPKLSPSTALAKVPGTYLSSKPSPALSPTELAQKLDSLHLAIKALDVAQFSVLQEDAPACDVCGSITVRSGNCYKCFNCGSSLGCS